VVMTSFDIGERVERLRSDRRLKILFLARLEPAKGVLETLEAVEKLLHRGIDVSLTIAGNGPALEDLQRFLDAHRGLGASVELAGYVRGEAKRALFLRHHVYCFPSEYWEGMPNSVLEAMALAMPIVTCPVGGLADFFEDGRMGHLVPRRDASLVADRLARLAGNREAAMAMAAYNHDYATKRFMARDVARRLGEIYLSVARCGGEAVLTHPTGAGGS